MGRDGVMGSVHARDVFFRLFFGERDQHLGRKPTWGLGLGTLGPIRPGDLGEPPGGPRTSSWGSWVIMRMMF